MYLNGFTSDEYHLYNLEKNNWYLNNEKKYYK